MATNNPPNRITPIFNSSEWIYSTTSTITGSEFQGTQGNQGIQGSNTGFQGYQGNQGVYGYQGSTGAGFQGALKESKAPRATKALLETKEVVFRAAKALLETKAIRDTKEVVFRATKALKVLKAAIKAPRALRGTQGAQGTQGNQGYQGLTPSLSPITLDTTNSRVGIVNATPAYPLDVTGDINTSSSYRIGGSQVLFATGLGSAVTVSSLTSVGSLSSLSVVGTFNINTNTIYAASGISRVGINTISPAYALDVVGDTNISTGSVYRINGTSVLTATALSSSVTSSSLTSVGTLTSLTVSGALTVDTNTITVDATNHRVGIVKTTPAYPLDVTGELNLSTGSVYRINTKQLLAISSGNTLLYDGLGTTNAVTLKSSGLYLNASNGSTLASSSSVGIAGVGSSDLYYGSSGGYHKFWNTTSGTEAFEMSNGSVNLPASASNQYQIFGTNVLSKTTLGSTVVNSSLTSLGTLTALTLATGMVQTYTPTLTCGTNLTASTTLGYYMTFGAIKFAWGTGNCTWNAAATSLGANNITMPSSLFTTMYATIASISSVGAIQNQYITGAGKTTTTYNFYAYQNTATNGASFEFSFLAIGT